VFNAAGISGAGPEGRALAAPADLAVLISKSRGPDALGEVIAELPPGTTAVTVARAARADLVILAIPFVRVPKLTRAVRTGADASWSTPPTSSRSTPEYSGYVDLGEDTGTEWVGRQLPGATMIKAFNAMFASYISPDRRHTEGRQAVFYAGDDEGA
jgi:predicted dinucleotide-binding enzyme